MVRITALILMLALSLTACETATGGAETPPIPGQLEPYIAKGRVVDTWGNPLVGVQIIVDNTVFYNSAVTGTTDAQGNYSIRVGDGSWRVYAKMEREYNGYTYEIDLAPDTFDSFAGLNGAVRNFTWKLTGKKPEPLVGYFGGGVLVFGDPNEFYDVENVEVTLTPVGPLIDGSTGQTIVKRPNPPGGEDPYAIVDVPIGRYSVSAVYKPAGAATVPMVVGSAACDGYAASRTIDFDPEDYNRARVCVKPQDGTIPPGELTLSGTVSAPSTEDVAGTVVVACYVVGESCDEARSRAVEITETGWRADFVIDGLAAESYDLLAVKDANGDGVYFNDGDFYAEYGSVTPPAAGLELRLEVIEGTDPGEVEPFSVQGQAVDTQGRPIAGAKVWIDPALSYSGGLEVYTDASGSYKVTNVLHGPSYAKAWIEVDYGGERYCLRLGMPSARDYEAFSPEPGVIRNFQWQLTGVIKDLRDYDSYFGGEVRIFPYNIQSGIAELTFTPTAPLVDGSTIQPFTRTIDLAKDVMVYDIPLGLYDVTAVLVEADGTRTPLKVGSEYSEPVRTDSAALAFQSLGFCSDGSGLERAFLHVENP